MIQLYKQTPISIFLNDIDKLIVIKFSDISIKMRSCQFIRFNNYLECLAKKIEPTTNKVKLRLVRDDLTVKLSLSDFLQLSHGVKIVVSKTFNSEMVINN